MLRFLLLGAAIAAAAPTASEAALPQGNPRSAAPTAMGTAAPALRAWLLLPPETTQEARVEVEGTRVILQRLLGPVEPELVDSPEGNRQALRVDSAAFDPALSADERDRLVEILKRNTGRTPTAGKTGSSL